MSDQSYFRSRADRLIAPATLRRSALLVLYRRENRPGRGSCFMNARTDRIKGRSAYGGVLLVLCQINGLYRYWFLADTGAAQTVIRPQVANSDLFEV